MSSQYHQPMLLPPNSDETIEQYLKSLPQITARQVGEAYNLPTLELDIHFTIPQLAYLTHNFYRYYGKYPSILGGYLIDRYAERGAIFDNYLGSGTTLVEARIRGLDSSGVDVNPIAVLAANVKARRYDDLVELKQYLMDIQTHARAVSETDLTTIPNWKYLSKWFTPSNVVALAQLKHVILSNPPSPMREFALTCFLAIVRRCSNAYDGEVRPHINPKKKPREPFAAFTDKFMDMLEKEQAFLSVIPPHGRAAAFCASNTEPNLSKYMPFASPSLVISHPPYLNCFNYYAVFNLENIWAQGFEEVNMPESWVKANEHLCWPATNPRIIEQYFTNFATAYSNLRQNITPSTRLAIVIGDATLRKELIPVHKRILELLPNCGFQPVEILYRTTHYGIGKYAYRTRADYHGEAEKKDGVIVAKAV
jgi:hypothetical protein